MITPDYLEYQLNCLDVHKSLQESILKDIARRMIKNPHKLTETVEWQVQKLQEAGYLYSDIIRGLAKITGALESEICFLFEDAQTEIFNYDDEVVVSSGKKAEEIKNISPKMKNIWNAATKKTVTEAINLTKTTANTSHSAYIRACDLAHMQVSSGAFDYVTAIRNGIKAAAKQGVTVTYPSGWKDTLDVAVRRSVLTGVNQTAGELQEMRAKEMNHDIMELTAHSGAREEHAKWQGKLVSLSGKKGYLSLRDIGYGEPGGFKGINCRHNWHMYFKGMPRAYTDKELKDMQNETVVYNGQPIPVWKAREYQRSLERGIKKNKRELIMCDEARKYTDDKDLKAGLDIDFQNAAKKLKAREKNLKDFCRQTGLKYDSSRVQVFSAETERGIRNWDKSIAQKAVAANKQASELPKVAKAVDTLLQNKLDYDIIYKNKNMRGIVPSNVDVKNVRIIAGNGTSTKLRDTSRLSAYYNNSENLWQKKTGIVESKYGNYEIHWYEYSGTQYEAKLKGYKEK